VGYTLLVYGEDKPDPDYSIARIDSEHPFSSVHVGDLLDLAKLIDDSERIGLSPYQKHYARITSVIHEFDREDLQMTEQRTMVFTEVGPAKHDFQ